MLSSLLVAITLITNGLPGSTQEESDRIQVIKKVRPSVVSVFGQQASNGGSGALISPDGFALTNFHVVSGTGVALRCGLDDGNLYDAVVVSLDPVGDVALIKLLGRDDFPTATLGDSDQLELGTPVLAMGNPFLLATDFQPSVSFGMVSGLHRYQFPSQNEDSTLLEYADCIQTDASINPGNSGGPLFDLNGQLVGINGRISLDKRGRVNVGVGYAISINQIKNFMLHLHGGLIIDHARLGATVHTLPDGRTVVRDIETDSDAYLKGLRREDEIVSVAGRPIASPNQLLNVIGVHPEGWRLELVYRRNQTKFTISPRVLPKNRMGVLEQAVRPPTPPTQQPPLPEAVQKVYEAKQGFANYHFNRLKRDQLLHAMKPHATTLGTSPWRLTLQDNSATQATVTLSDNQSSWKAGELEVTFPSDNAEGNNLVWVVAAMDFWRRLVVLGESGFGECWFAGGHPSDKKSLLPVVTTTYAGYETEWLFDPEGLHLVGMNFRQSTQQRWLHVRFEYGENPGNPASVASLHVQWPQGEQATFKVTGWEAMP